MTDTMSDEDWDEYFEGLELDHQVGPGERFKWGWNFETGEAEIWEVTGPGDGAPVHKQRLREAWGRELSHASGDVVGCATVAIASEAELMRIWVQAYWGKDVPSGVRDWFARTYPGAEITCESL